MKSIKNTSIVPISLLFLFSCSSVNITEEQAVEGDISTVDVYKVENSKASMEAKAIFANATVYFDFDKYTLSSKSLQTLKSVISAMKENNNITITISGHADERGTREYNLALGQRRAEAVKEYLMLNGINSGKIKTISYGEEQLAVYGNNEASHAKNRRAEIN